MKKALVFGTFDGLHEGHLDLFKQARELGDYLIVVVSRDSTVKKNKNKTPKFNEQERLKAVQENIMVNEARLGNEEHDPTKDRYTLIKEINPDIVCLGYDQARFAEKLHKELAEMGLGHVRVEILKPYKPEIYHSSLLNK